MSRYILGCAQCGATLDYKSSEWPTGHDYYDICSQECREAREVRAAIQGEGKEIDWSQWKG